MELLNDSINKNHTEETTMDIIHMRNALDELSRLKKRPHEYVIIYDSIISYLKKWCIHSIITDDIDLDYGEKTLRISYCEKCFLHETQLCGTDLTITTNRIRTTSD